MYVADARLSWRQDLDIQGGASRQLTVAGQEYRDVVFDRLARCIASGVLNRYRTRISVACSITAALISARINPRWEKKASYFARRVWSPCRSGLTRHSIRDRREVKISVPAPVLKPHSYVVNDIGEDRSIADAGRLNISWRRQV